VLVITAKISIHEIKRIFVFNSLHQLSNSESMVSNYVTNFERTFSILVGNERDTGFNPTSEGPLFSMSLDCSY